MNHQFYPSPELQTKKKYILNIDFQAKNENDGLIFFDGIINGLEIHAETKKNKLSIISDLVDDNSYGEWIAILRKNNTFEIKTDSFGFYTVFYYQDDTTLILSNDLPSITAHCRKIGKKLTFNKELFYLTIGSSDQFFNHPISNDSPINEIKNLGAKEKLLVGSAVILHKYQLPRSTCKPDLYKLNLEKTILKIGEMLKKITIENENTKFNLFLSGGKDSRTCLALLLRFIPHEKIQITTRNPKNSSSISAYKTLSEDYAISRHIVEKYNLSWYENNNEHFAAYETSYCDHFNFHCQYSISNYYAYFKPSNTIKIPTKKSNTIEIRGGGGEILRQYDLFERLQMAGAQLDNTQNSLENDIIKIYNLLVKCKPIENNQRENSKLYFINSFSDLAGRNIQEVLDSRYFSHRNRRHFGHIRKTLALGTLLLSPLLNEQLFNLSLHLTDEDRKNGKLLYDIINLCAPELNKIPFQSGNWSKKFTSEDFSYENIDKNNISYECKNKIAQNYNKKKTLNEREGISSEIWINTTIKDYVMTLKGFSHDLIDQKLELYIQSKLGNPNVETVILMKLKSFLSFGSTRVGNTKIISI